jgi:ribose 5-phosphate isomerase B
MKIYAGSDHAGFKHKREIVQLLKSMGHDVTDAGTTGEESVDYARYAHVVAKAVSGGAAERGILVCGTGIGMSIAANRHRKVRAALVHDEFTAKMSRAHNDANVLCMGARILDAETMKALVRVWLETPFEGGRHERRIAGIEDSQ